MYWKGVKRDVYGLFKGIKCYIRMNNFECKKSYCKHKFVIIATYALLATYQK